MIEDGRFFPRDWSEKRIVDTTNGGAGRFIVETMSAGGVPDEYRQISHKPSTRRRRGPRQFSPGDLAVGHRNTSTAYDPAASGPLEQVSFSFHARLVSDPSQGTDYRPLIYQAGTWYVCMHGATVDHSEWRSYEYLNLTAEDFVEGIDPETPGPPPDFSVGAPPLQFGYRTSNHATDVSPPTTGLDNFKVVTDPAPQQADGRALPGLSTGRGFENHVTFNMGAYYRLGGSNLRSDNENFFFTLCGTLDFIKGSPDRWTWGIGLRLTTDMDNGVHHWGPRFLYRNWLGGRHSRVYWQLAPGLTVHTSSNRQMAWSTGYCELELGHESWGAACMSMEIVSHRQQYPCDSNVCREISWHAGARATGWLGVLVGVGVLGGLFVAAASWGGL